MSALDALDNGDGIATLMRKFYPILLRQGWDGGTEAIGIDIAFDLDNPRIKEAYQQRIKAASGIAQTTLDDIKRLTLEATEHGWSADDLAAKFHEAAETLSASRAMLISRTETAAAYTAGSMAYYRETGQVDRKQWALGPEPCEICQPLGDKVVGIDEEFDGGFDAPPAHPRCSCDVLPLLSEVA